MMKRILALAVALLMLMLSAALADGEWHPAEKNAGRFRQLTELLGDAVRLGGADTAAIDKLLEQIRQENEDDYDIARAVTDHWYEVMLDPDYKMYNYWGGRKANELEWSREDLSGKHAFVVLGFQLSDGHMKPELIGRCDAAAAAARSFPDSYIVTTGGVTGGNNPDNNSEAGLMRSYLRRSGIDENRIFAEKKSLTTLENAEYSFRILQEQGIEKITIVTSDYHQRWGQVLFNALAAIYEKCTGYKVRIVGNYNYRAKPESAVPGTYLQIVTNQLAMIFRNGVRIYGTGEQ